MQVTMLDGGAFASPVGSDATASTWSDRLVSRGGTGGQLDLATELLQNIRPVRR